MDVRKKSMSHKLLCHVCLSIGEQLYELNEEKDVKYYLNALNEIQITKLTDVPQLCYNCLSSLHNAITFREQVISSFKVLEIYNDKKTNHTPANEAPIIEIEVSKIDGYEKNEDSVKQESEIKWINEKEYKGEDGDDIFFDEPICEDTDLQETQDTSVTIESPTFKKRTKNKKDKIKKKFSKKVSVILLSYEEMMEDRERSINKESFKQAEFKCYDCCTGFKTQKELEKHLEKKHSEKIGNYRCPICKTVHANVELFTLHYKRHNRRYVCSICNKRTVGKRSMENHFAVRHSIPLKQYKCDICGKLFDSPNSHRYHLETHKGRLKCKQCDKTFMHRSALKSHRETVHEMNNTFPCEFCNKNFKWKTSVLRHIRDHHSENKQSPVAYCEVCNVSFTLYSNYQRHMNTSLKHVSKDQLRLICDHCKERFSNKTKLRDHIEDKHLHRTYTCQICLKVFKNRVAQDQHVRNVHKRRPKNKICHHCGKGFPTKSQLESHIRSHTGERPFSCQHCPCTFSQSSNLHKHRKQVHLEIKPKKYPVKKKEDKLTDFLHTTAPISFNLYEPDVTENIMI